MCWVQTKISLSLNPPFFLFPPVPLFLFYVFSSSSGYLPSFYWTFVQRYRFFYRFSLVCKRAVWVPKCSTLNNCVITSKHYSFVPWVYCAIFLYLSLFLDPLTYLRRQILQNIYENLIHIFLLLVESNRLFSKWYGALWVSIISDLQRSVIFESLAREWHK